MRRHFGLPEELILPPIQYPTFPQPTQIPNPFSRNISQPSMYDTHSGHTKYGSSQYPTPTYSATTDSSPVNAAEENLLASHYHPDVNLDQDWLLAPINHLPQPSSLPSSYHGAATTTSSVHYHQVTFQRVINADCNSTLKGLPRRTLPGFRSTT